MPHHGTLKKVGHFCKAGSLQNELSCIRKDMTCFIEKNQIHGFINKLLYKNCKNMDTYYYGTQDTVAMLFQLIINIPYDFGYWIINDRFHYLLTFQSLEIIVG